MYGVTHEGACLMQLSEETAKRNRAITFAGLKGIGGNAVLVTLKIIIGLSANSIAIILTRLTSDRYFIIRINYNRHETGRQARR